MRNSFNFANLDRSLGLQRHLGDLNIYLKSSITDEPWGIYYKPDFHFGGVQGGAMPYVIDTDPDEVALEDLTCLKNDFCRQWQRNVGVRKSLHESGDDHDQNE